jgi:hypothetical protein
MILLKNGILIISYIPYVYKDGGFCISISPSNEISTKEISLNVEEIRELQNSDFQVKNHIPDYRTLLEKYFNELKTEFI